MTKHRYTLLTTICIVILLALVLTNPTKKDHIIAIKANLISTPIFVTHNKFADFILDAFLEKSVSYKNFYIFSFTRFNYKNADVTLSSGLLSYVQVSKYRAEEGNDKFSNLNLKAEGEKEGSLYYIKPEKNQEGYYEGKLIVLINRLYHEFDFLVNDESIVDKLIKLPSEAVVHVHYKVYIFDNKEVYIVDQITN